MGYYDHHHCCYPSYGFAYPTTCGSFYGNTFILIVVLFILLIVIGACYR